MNDVSKRRRPSAIRTEVNIEWIKQVMRGDHHLIFKMITSQLDMKRLCLQDYHQRFGHV